MHLPVLSVQGDVTNVPVPLVVHVTEPVGVSGVPAADVSATVAVHEVELFTTIDAGAQTTVTLVVLGLTTTLAPPELTSWTPSAPP